MTHSSEAMGLSKAAARSAGGALESCATARHTINMSRKAAMAIKQVPAFRATLLMVAAIAFTAANGTAMAQQKGATPGVKIQTGQVRRTVVGRSTIGAPIEILELSRRVNYTDLDLTRTSGAVELERRVRDTAAAACEELDRQDPLAMSDTDEFSCVREATNDAMKQAKAVIAAAETNGAPSASTRVR
jgi:UrcA family protein